MTKICVLTKSGKMLEFLAEESFDFVFKVMNGIELGSGHPDYEDEDDPKKWHQYMTLTDPVTHTKFCVQKRYVFLFKDS